MRTQFDLRSRPLRAVAGVLTMATAGPAVALAAAGGAGAEPSLSIQVHDRHLASGQSLVVAGRADSSAAGNPVALEYRAAGSATWRRLERATVARDGAYRLRVRPRTSGHARVVLGADERRFSAPRPVAIAARIAPVSRRLDVRSGERAAVRGRLLPGQAGRTIRLEHLSRSGWRTLARSRTARHGDYRLAWRARRPGTLRVRVRFSGDARNAGIAGRSTRLDVFRPARATWYALVGNRLACGGRMAAGTLGVAHKTLPCGTPLTLRYRGREVRVRVIDRGPFSASLDYDLTSATKRRLGYGDIGTVLATR
jgi:peptidoglycan lytic transglycosylase